MNVRDLMSQEVVTLSESDNLGLADDIMRLGRIRHMPVVAGDRLVGILSQRDLFRAAISSVLHLRHSAEREWLTRITIREVMTRTVITVGPDVPIREAVDVMIGKRIGALPVVEDGKLVGLLSESDCLVYLARVLDIMQQKRELTEVPFPD